MHLITQELGWRINGTSEDILAAADRYAQYHTAGRYTDGSYIRYPGVDLWTEKDIASIFWGQARLRPASSVPANLLPIVEDDPGPVLLGGDIQLSTAHRVIKHPSSGKAVRFFNLRSVPVKSGFYTLTFDPHKENYRIRVYAHHKFGEWRKKSKHNLEGDWQPAR